MTRIPPESLFPYAVSFRPHSVKDPEKARENMGGEDKTLRTREMYPIPPGQCPERKTEMSQNLVFCCLVIRQPLCVCSLPPNNGTLRKRKQKPFLA